MSDRLAAATKSQGGMFSSTGAAPPVEFWFERGDKAWSRPMYRCQMAGLDVCFVDGPVRSLLVAAHHHCRPKASTPLLSRQITKRLGCLLNSRIGPLPSISYRQGFNCRRDGIGCLE